MVFAGMMKGFAHTYEQPVRYRLKLGEAELEMNALIGRQLTLTFLGEIRCTHCGRRIKKTYDGFCYPCFQTLPQADLCIVKPHECHYHLGTCRDPEFAKTYCMVPHYVYLAVSSGVKVGLTRKHNERKRWVDQGAVQAVPIAEAPNRKTAGELEFALSQHMADKTDWRKMLKGETADTDLLELREEVFGLFPEAYKPYALPGEEKRGFEYPVEVKPEKVVSLNLDKNPIITARLTGIKGNYLLFEGGGVLNVQKYAGYHVQVEVALEDGAAEAAAGREAD
ncbi:DUF2797 domain-containing protein [Gorillibacterium sp. sgz5001074]|uniref:DUF2797 domain-containing protein n=1 Tax=Gorillibacterium sp. sgz5001074 TaxID=3446695 RepID=UPI003F66A68F